MLNKNNVVVAGELKIVPVALPVLESGEYVLHAEQKLTGLKNESRNYDKTITQIQVAGPRYALTDDDVYSVYPPRKPASDYSATLPNLALKRKTLPWERRIDGVKGDAATHGLPWIVLLLLDEDELRQQDIKMKSVTLKELRTPARDILLPDLALELDERDELELDPKGKETPRYNVIEVPCSLLLDILPYENELQYLAHARQVDTSNKETTIDAKGWSSIVVGNRLPAHHKKNTVFAVSLEGHRENIKKAKLSSEAGSRVRLTVLYSWSFESSGVTFKNLVEKIDENTGPLKVAVPASVTNAAVKDALKFGFTPLTHKLRNGSSTISWYRGPLVASNTSKDKVATSFADADDALMYDERTTMFDISQAAAWQLGRILAQQAPGFVDGLIGWKKDFETKAREEMARELIAARFQDQFNFGDGAAESDSNGQNDKKPFADAVNMVETNELMNCLMAELWTKKSNLNG